MNTFSAVERVLAYHHTTSASPMLIKDLATRASVTRAELNTLLASWPQGYKITKMRLQEFVESSQIPLDLKTREKKFLTERNVDPKPVSAPHITPQRAKVISSKVVKNTPKKLKVLSMDEIMQRVLQKQAMAESAAKESKQKREAFLKAQIPAVEGVLRCLCSTNQNFSLTEIVRKVRGSLKSPLSAEEVMQVLDLIAAKAPAFCSIVDAGAVKCVKLTAVTA